MSRTTTVVRFQILYRGADRKWREYGRDYVSNTIARQALAILQREGMDMDEFRLVRRCIVTTTLETPA
jgi:hypothetical protein